MLTRMLSYVSRRDTAALQTLTCFEAGRSQHLSCAKAVQPSGFHARKHAASTGLCAPTWNVSTNLAKQPDHTCSRSRQLKMGHVGRKLSRHFPSCPTIRSQTDACSIPSFRRRPSKTLLRRIRRGTAGLLHLTWRVNRRPAKTSCALRRCAQRFLSCCPPQ